jgi:hypothetical protein
MSWNDRPRQLILEPGAPPGATNVVADRRFKVQLLPEGTTKDVTYSGKRVQVTF